MVRDAVNAVGAWFDEGLDAILIGFMALVLMRVPEIRAAMERQVDADEAEREAIRKMRHAVKGK